MNTPSSLFPASAQAYAASAVFDGTRLVEGGVLVTDKGRVLAVMARGDAPASLSLSDLGAGVIAPGFVDLQVNGGGGVMFNDAPTVETLRRIGAAHQGLGTAGILATLITSDAATTVQAIDAAIAAVRAGVPGIAGLHLEGPHLDPNRQGAHEPGFIRPMDDRDLAMLIKAAAELPVLKITVAPASVTPAQIRAMTAAGILVSLGHADASYDDCIAAADAGAACVTHLFNAMSQLGNRAPGLVGAALDLGGFSAGIIADGHHVHPATLRAALRGKRGPGKLFLVSDAMAVAGTDTTEFPLDGRIVRRENGRLTLPDGTLAGADLSMAQAVQYATTHLDIALADALAMATSIPADLAGLAEYGRLTPRKPAQFILYDPQSATARPYGFAGADAG